MGEKVPAEYGSNGEAVKSVLQAFHATRLVRGPAELSVGASALVIFCGKPPQSSKSAVVTTRGLGLSTLLQEEVARLTARSVVDGGRLAK